MSLEYGHANADGFAGDARDAGRVCGIHAGRAVSEDADGVSDDRAAGGADVCDADGPFDHAPVAHVSTPSNRSPFLFFVY